MKKKEEKTKNLWFLYLLIIFVVSVFIWSEYYMPWYRIDRFKKNGVITDCLVYELGYMKGSFVRAEFFVPILKLNDSYQFNEKRFICVQGNPISIKINERFKLVYDKEDPKTAEILFQHPIIPVDFDTVKGRVIKYRI